MNKEPQFTSFPLSKIIPGVTLPGEIYLFLSGHFIKYKGSDDSISKEKYNEFIFKKFQYIFVLTEDFPKFNQWSEANLTKDRSSLVAQVGKENSEIVEKHLEMKEQFFKFITTEITNDEIAQIVGKTREFIQKINERPNVTQVLHKIALYNPTIADHSVNVANLSTFLSMNMGYSQQLMLENIYLGGLLHDYGKVKINSKHFENPNSKAYAMAMRKHPELGRNSLLMDESFPDEVLRIILEHHERHDGAGYPRGIKGAKIYDLTKIVAIANIFDNLVMAGKGSVPERQKAALLELEKDNGHVFDPRILEKAIKVLRFVS